MMLVNETFKDRANKNPDAFEVMVVRWDEPTRYFENFTEAKREIPALDIMHNTKDFTWAMFGGINKETGKEVMRFEDWETDRIMSV